MVITYQEWRGTFPINLEFSDNMTIQDFHYHTFPRRVSIVNNELFIASMYEQEHRQIVLQKVLLRNDFSRIFVPSISIIDEIQWNVIESYRDNITQSIFTMMFRSLFRKNVFGAFKRAPQQQNPRSSASIDGQGKTFLISSLTDIMNVQVQKNIGELLMNNCDGCDENQPNQLGHECMTMSYELQLAKYFDKAICKMDMKTIATTFATKCINYKKYFTNAFFNELNFSDILNTLKDMFLMSDPDAWAFSNSIEI